MEKRPVIALFNGNLHYSNYRVLIQEIYKEFESDDVNLHTYIGANLAGFFSKKFMRNLCSENHYYSIFPYSFYDKPNLIVIAMGGIVWDGDAKMVQEFLIHFSDTPILMLENTTPFPNVRHVLLDNFEGSRDMTEHLITEHGCRRLAFLSGPEQNNDANQRLRGFVESLAQHGLSPVGVEHGNFTPYVRDEANRLLDVHPDAIMCANDIMAAAVYEVCKERGIRVGSDVLVAGFDDVPMAAYLEPPLASVRQDYGLIAKKIAEEARAFLKGKPLQDVHVPTMPVFRESCGCDLKRGKFCFSGAQIIERDELEARMILQTVESSVTLRNMLFTERSEEEMFRNLGNVLHELGAKKSCILLHEKPIRQERPKLSNPPESIRVVMRQEGEVITASSVQEAPVLGYGGFPDVFGQERSIRLTDFVLYYQELEYGVLVAEVDPKDLLFFYSLSLEIGSGLRFHELSEERRSANNVLEEQNQILSYVANHDALTGLYNRAGIMNEIFNYVRSFPEGDCFALIMADLDHLKQINDRLGHNAGDSAICFATEILREVLPENSPIGRNGGDEFIAVLHLDEREPAAEVQRGIQEELRAACARFDEKEDRPFYMGISAGVALFGMENLSEFLKVIEEADQKLYEAKKVRRSNVVK